MNRNKLVLIKKKNQDIHNHLLQLNFYQLRKYAKSIKGIGKYGNLKKNELIELILSKSSKPKIKLKKKLKTKTQKDHSYQELNELNFYQLRNYAKSIKGIGKYGNLKKNELIKLIISKSSKPKPKIKLKTKLKPKMKLKTHSYQELNELNFYQLRNYAKSIKGIGKYGNLKKNELIKLIISKSSIPAQRNLIDEPIPPLPPSAQKILKPSEVVENKKIQKKKEKEKGEKTFELEDLNRQVENLKRQIEVLKKKNSKLEDLKKQISDLYLASAEKQYDIIHISGKSSKKFTSYFDQFKVHPFPQTTEIDFGKVLFEITNMAISKRGLKNGDKIRLILSHPEWNKPISTKLITISGAGSYQPFSNYLINNLIDFVEYKEVPLSEVLIEIQSTKVPRGMGRLRVMKSNLNHKKSVITIKNDDSICLARAIVTALANINQTQWTKTQLNDGFNRSRQLQKNMAEKLHEEAGVEINEFGSTLEDVIKFANHLKIQINIVDFEYFNELLLTTENEHNNQMIYLLKNKNHFDVITSMTGFLCKNYYCHTCKKTYKKRDCHKCPRKCLACFKYFKDGNLCSGEIIECQDCNRSFFGKECFDEHKRNRAKKNPSRLETI